MRRACHDRGDTQRKAIPDDVSMVAKRLSKELALLLEDITQELKKKKTSLWGTSVGLLRSTSSFHLFSS